MAIAGLANTPLLLIVRDGWGHNPNPSHEAFNAVAQAETPIDAGLARTWPATLIRTSGEAVGLPAGTMGNSEVGHQNIGAGRIVAQELMRITAAIRDGSFAQNPGLRAAFAHARDTGGCVHLLGLVSDGQVHSDLEHLEALIRLAAELQTPADRLLVHAITDGRDTSPFAGLGYVQRVEQALARAGVGRIATVIGRFYAMDRDRRWQRVSRAYACLTDHGPSPAAERALQTRTAPTATAAIQAYYDHPTDESRKGDEFVLPARIVPGGDGWRGVKAGDSVIFFNFRGDRPREICKAFVLDEGAWRRVEGGGFPRGPRIEDLHFCTLCNYEQDLPASVAFERPPKMPNILGAFLEARGIAQFRCAETEKFPHVTFFFNDYREPPFRGERRRLVPSPTEVPTYDLKPQMSAPEVCGAVLERLAAPDTEPVMVVNFANADMVGHTGSLAAATRAVEMVDECVGRIAQAVLAAGGALLVTADHGNAEQMWNPELDLPHTAHTVYDVPLYVVGEAFRGRRLREGGCLADLAPTLLAMLGLDPPAEMTGSSLLEAVAAFSG